MSAVAAAPAAAEGVAWMTTVLGSATAAVSVADLADVAHWTATCAGWSAATVAAIALRRLRGRLEAAARAEHELRGPVTVLLLACDRMRREPMGRRYVRALEVELERMAAGLAALTAARTGQVPGSSPRGVSTVGDLESFASGALGGWAPTLSEAGRPSRFRWDAGKVGLPHERAAIATALGNMVANAAEHGSGAVEVRGSRLPGAVRVEVRNETSDRPRARQAGRGRGLGIAAAAARTAGGGVAVTRGASEFCAALELPLDPTTAFEDWPDRPARRER